MVRAVYKDAPLIENDRAIAIGINSIIVWFWSMKIFLIAGSSNHAIDPVAPATTTDNKSEINNLKRCFFT